MATLRSSKENPSVSRSPYALKVAGVQATRACGPTSASSGGADQRRWSMPASRRRPADAGR
jgi:hypothetical protein